MSWQFVDSQAAHPPCDSQMLHQLVTVADFQENSSKQRSIDNTL